ncbi:MAG: hypothetical protein ACYTFG_20185 [Planctomycetota bacterium]
MKTLIAAMLVISLVPCLNADEIPVPPSSTTTATAPAPATVPVPTLEDRIAKLENALASFYETDFRFEARMLRIESRLGLPEPGHKHEWKPTTPAIVKEKTVSAICRCGVFDYVPFEIQPE